MVYAHGGDKRTRQDTVEMMEELVREYVMHLTRVISETAEYKRSMDDEAVKFSLRLDPVRLKRVEDISRPCKEVERVSRVSLGGKCGVDTH